MHSGSPITISRSIEQMSLGIASLIFEGRLLSDDQYALPNVPYSEIKKKNFPTSSSQSTETVQDTQRIMQKLQLLKSCPGTSKEVSDCTLSIDNPVSGTSADECEDDAGYGESSTKSNGLYLETLQSLATTCINATPLSSNKINSSFLNHNTQCSQQFAKSGSSLASKLASSKCESKCKNDVLMNTKHELHPKQGPHCEAFLKRIAILKTQPEECDEYHLCSEVLNKYCREWSISESQIKSILKSGETLCIEVFLGPEINPVLMEQWIIQVTDKVSFPTMTIQSLCSAIRSQLYFSQISAWTDLIKGKDFEYSDNARVKIRFNNTPRLDIFFRIKPSTIISSFIEKPIVHNFPDTPISDYLAIRVQLKSCKRFDKIPESNPILMLVDDQRGPCTETGKHRCKNSFDDDPLNYDMAEQLSTSSTNSHREKQLMKYKKRLLKREKKKKYMNTDYFSSTEYFKCDNQLQNFSTQASINSIRPPLYITSSSPSSPSSSSNDSCVFSQTQATQTSITETMSVATQTDDVNVNKKMTNNIENDVLYLPSCDLCGSDMQCVCWNCDKLFKSNNNLNEKMDSGDLLLQSIQRTALKKKNHQMIPQLPESHINQMQNKSSISSPEFANNFSSINCTKNNSNISDEYIERSTCDTLNNLDLSDCRFCIKRQKIKHNYNVSSKNNISNSATISNCRRTMSESIGFSDEDETIRPTHEMSTSANSALSFEELKSYRRAFSEDVIDSMSDNEPKSKCMCSDEKKLLPSPPYYVNEKCCMSESISPEYKNKVSPLTIKCPIEVGRIIPKLNLTSILDTPISPLSIAQNNSSDIFPIHKSNSAPTFNPIYSPTSLSPRFYKQAAIIKRRSRHLSDKSSERSSIGSEEQLSDEEFGCGLDNTFSPSISPNKQLIRFNKSVPQRLKPFLGTLEESLFQNRIDPKFQIQGYKVLLGASGGFCPTQLTIPAITSLYELKSENISTPYMVSFFYSKHYLYCVNVSLFLLCHVTELTNTLDSGRVVAFTWFHFRPISVAMGKCSEFYHRTQNVIQNFLATWI